MSKIQVAIMMGSKSDHSVMEEASKVLDQFGISNEMRVLSAHRTPKETVEYVDQFKKRGVRVVICGAGVAAALAGTVAAHTTLPVIGVPLDAALGGMDALLSTAQMPPGVPVGTMAIGKMGAQNAAFYALRILALNDQELEKRLDQYREKQRKQILDIKLP